MSEKPSSPYNRETTDMERIAREAREFREQEAKRIATEKEEARLAAQRQKELERERVAQQSGQFLQDVKKQQENLDELKRLSAQQKREKDLPMPGSDVSKKAKWLSDKEDLERKRIEEERSLRQERSLKKSSPKDSIDSGSLLTFSSDVSEPSSEDVTSRQPEEKITSKLSKQSTVYYDAAMNQSSLDRDTPDPKGDDELSASVRKLDTVYYDADGISGDTDAVDESNQTYRRQTHPQTGQSPEMESVTGISSAPYSTGFQEAGEASNQAFSHNAETVYRTPRQVSRTVESPQKSVYHDAQSREMANISSPAGVEARSLFPAGRSDDDFLTDPAEAEIAINPHEQESIITHRQWPVPKATKKSAKPGDENLSAYDRGQEASFEIPLEYNSANGSFLMTHDAKLSVAVPMAPSRVDGRWSGSLEGKASLGPSALTNSSAGSATLDYAVNPQSKLSLGMVRGHELYHPLVTIGGSFIRQRSALRVTFYHSASFLHAMLLEHSMYSLSFRHLFPQTRWILSSELSRRQELSVGLSNANVSSRLTWSLRNPSRPSVGLDLRPKITEDRFAHFSGEWQSVGIWHIGASLVQSLHSKVATIGLGVRLCSTRGLEWILSWSRGDATVRIPVVVASGIGNVRFVQVLYFSMISFLIQEGISEMWGWRSLDTAAASDQNFSLSPTIAASKAKAREDAELQKDLMARQAKRKRKEEAEKEGLVIRKATYSVEGGEEWDVTIPLQFWVNRSSLSLPPRSKSRLLGFFDIASDKEATSSQGIADLGAAQTRAKRWWREIWVDLLDLPTSGKLDTVALRLIPTLNILYDFKGQPYRITIEDEDELILPNPNATRL